MGAISRTRTAHGWVRVLYPPTCQKSLWPADARGCPNVAAYKVLTDMFPGCPAWFCACAKHAQLAIVAGRAFDLAPVEEWPRTAPRFIP